MAKYLDDNGLSYLWQKIKAHVNTAIAAIGKVPTGGTAGQILAKASGTDYDTEWITNSGAGNYLPISGGTLTGQLEIPDSAVADASQTPSASKYGTALYITDQQDRRVGYLGLIQETDGKLWAQLGATRDVNGSPAYNSLWIGLKEDGTPTVYVGGAQQAWRDALGMDVWGRIVGQASNLTLSTSWQKVPLSSFYGSGCSASSNGIKVAQGGNYWVQGTIYLTTGFTAGDLIHVAIYKNGTLINECRRHVAYANPYETFDVPATILSLSANDVVYIYAYNQNGARGLVQSLYNVGLHLHKVG